MNLMWMHSCTVTALTYFVIASVSLYVDDPVLGLLQPAFRRYMPPSSSGSKHVGQQVSVFTQHRFFKSMGGGGDRMGLGVPSGPAGTVHPKSCADGPFKGAGVHQKPH
jgi:hypothetical protein